MIIQSRSSWLSVGVDYGCTVFAWVGLGFLLWRGLVVSLGLAQASLNASLQGQSVSDIMLYAGIGVGNAFLLLLWSRYNAWHFGHRTARKAPPALSAEQLANSFQISLALQQQLSQARVMTLHHNSQGQLIGLVCNPPAALELAPRKPARIKVPEPAIHAGEDAVKRMA